MNYGGSFVSGLASGLDLNQVMQLQSMKWQQQEKKKAQQLEQDYVSQLNSFLNDPETTAFFKGMEDGTMDPYGTQSHNVSKNALLFSKEIGEYFKEYREAINNRNQKAAEQLSELIKVKIGSMTDLITSGFEINPEGPMGDMANTVTPESQRAMGMRETLQHTSGNFQTFDQVNQVHQASGGQPIQQDIPQTISGTDIPKEVADILNDAIKNDNIGLYNAIAPSVGLQPITENQLIRLKGRQENITGSTGNTILPSVSAQKTVDEWYTGINNHEDFVAANKKFKNTKEGQNAPEKDEKSYIEQQYRKLKEFLESILEKPFTEDGEEVWVEKGEIEEGVSNWDAAQSTYDELVKLARWYKEQFDIDLPLPKLRKPKIVPFL
jgi:hypothetical protein